MNPANNPAASFPSSVPAHGRYGSAEDIAAAATHLAGDGSRYITGTAISVDGGFAAYQDFPGCPNPGLHLADQLIIKKPGQVLRDEPAGADRAGGRWPSSPKPGFAAPVAAHLEEARLADSHLD